MSCVVNGSIFLQLVSDKGLCGGNGRCVSNSCVCDYPWTGAGDMVTTEGMSCANSLVADKVMWSLCLAVTFTGWFFAYTHFLCNNCERTSKDLLFVPMLIMMIIVYPLLMAVCIVHIFIEENIGVDVLITMLYLAYVVASTGIRLYIQRFLVHALSTNRMNNRFKRVMRAPLASSIVNVLGNGVVRALCLLVPISDTWTRYALGVVATASILLVSTIDVYVYMYLGSAFSVKGGVVVRHNNAEDTMHMTSGALLSLCKRVYASNAIILVASVVPFTPQLALYQGLFIAFVQMVPSLLCAAESHVILVYHAPMLSFFIDVITHANIESINSPVATKFRRVTKQVQDMEVEEKKAVARKTLVAMEDQLRAEIAKMDLESASTGSNSGHTGD